MKNRIMFLGLLLLFLGSGRMQAQALSVIEGQWLDATAKQSKLGLYQVENGLLYELASSNLTDKGHFGFAFYPEKEGYYVIAVNPGSKVNRYIFYFKPGDNLQFRIEGDNWQLIGDNTPENKEIERWHNLVQPLEGKAVYFMKKRSTYVDYFPLLEQTLPKVAALGKAQTPNKTFNQGFEDFKKYNLLEINLMLLSTPRTAHPKNTDYIDYYRHIDIKDLTTSLTLLDYPDATWLIESSYYQLLRSDTSSTEEQLSEKRKNIKAYLLGNESPIVNKTIKGEMMLHYASWVKDYMTIDLFRSDYGQCLATEDQVRRFNLLVSKLDDNSQGHPAIDFKFADMQGKEVALSDFKGKVVYIDIWATWCGPCKGEIPYMGKLEEEFKDNSNMVFMSVSIDAQKDQQKWKDMVKEKQMKGVQLFAGSRADDIAKPYKVKGIPRFILVGKDGNLISSEAPRPSSAEIRPLLKKALAQ